jgi:hypothetical protein
MAIRTWEELKIRYCEHAASDVCLLAELIYPEEWLPDCQPRVIAHRCSHGMQCNFDGRSNCIWSGTNPMIDPFMENF